VTPGAYNQNDCFIIISICPSCQDVLWTHWQQMGGVVTVMFTNVVHPQFFIAFLPHQVEMFMCIVFQSSSTTSQIVTTMLDNKIR